MEAWSLRVARHLDCIPRQSHESLTALLISRHCCAQRKMALLCGLQCSLQTTSAQQSSEDTRPTGAQKLLAQDVTRSWNMESIQGRQGARSGASLSDETRISAVFRSMSKSARSRQDNKGNLLWRSCPRLKDFDRQAKFHIVNWRRCYVKTRQHLLC